MVAPKIFTVLLLLFDTTFCNQFAPLPRTYKCVNGTCEQNPMAENIPGPGLELCQLNCAVFGSLWPIPTGNVNLGTSTRVVNLNNIKFSPAHPTKVLKNMTDNFSTTLQKMYESKRLSEKGANLTVDIVIDEEKTSTFVLFQTDESYSLSVSGCQQPNTITVQIEAQTIFGARHALETLSQLFAYDTVGESLHLLCSARITDRPAYEYRGLALDVTRHFIPVDSLTRVIDSLSFNKMNALHLHLSDSQGFTLQVNSRPQMTQYGAYSIQETYSKADLQYLKDYANVHGISIVPEIDMPSHVGLGWQWGSKEGVGDLLANYIDRPTEKMPFNCFGTPCGCLNLANANVTVVLKDILATLVKVFGNNSLYHLGSDEVVLDCWRSNTEIMDWMVKKGLSGTDEDFHAVWAEFEQNVFKILNNLIGKTGRYVLWTSSLTDGDRFSKYLAENRDELIVQVWSPSSTNDLPNLLAQNVSVIVSNLDAWYLDCGQPWWVGEGANYCTPVKDWRLMYNNLLYSQVNATWNITDPKQRSLILGGETAMWTEATDSLNLHTTLWPRVSAVAERLWSDPPSCWYQANQRLLTHRERLINRGIPAAPIAPTFCEQHPNHCRTPADQWKFRNIQSTCEKFWSTPEMNTARSVVLRSCLCIVALPLLSWLR